MGAIKKLWTEEIFTASPIHLYPLKIVCCALIFFDKINVIKINENFLSVKASSNSLIIGQITRK
jgi:hypothetical protein